jgi:hypothetical protein
VPTKKTTTKRTGTKKTARNNAGKTAKKGASASATGMLNMRRCGPRSIAEAIVAREATHPSFGRDVLAWVEKVRAETSATPHVRAAQVMPRETHATH